MNLNRSLQPSASLFATFLAAALVLSPAAKAESQRNPGQCEDFITLSLAGRIMAVPRAPKPWLNPDPKLTYVAGGLCQPQGSRPIIVDTLGVNLNQGSPNANESDLPRQFRLRTGRNQTRDHYGYWHDYITGQRANWIQLSDAGDWIQYQSKNGDTVVYFSKPSLTAPSGYPIVVDCTGPKGELDAKGRSVGKLCSVSYQLLEGIVLDYRFRSVDREPHLWRRMDQEIRGFVTALIRSK